MRRLRRRSHSKDWQEEGEKCSIKKKKSLFLAGVALEMAV